PSGTARSADHAGIAGGTGLRHQAHHRRPEYRRSIFASAFDLCGRGTWERNNELGKDVRFGHNIYSAAVLFHDDVVTDRKAKPGSFPSRLGGEEGIEYLLFKLLRDTGTVVADPDFHSIAQAARTRAQGWLESFAGRFLVLGRRVKAIRNQI